MKQRKREKAKAAIDRSRNGSTGSAIMAQFLTPANSPEVQNPEGKHVHDITVTVFAPSHVEPKHFTWAATKKVAAAAAEAAAAFRIDVEAPTFQKGDEVLDREKHLPPLASRTMTR